ncbi:unnamed protein product [Allacma fusca]|uniref:Zinc transporter ZIP14 n=1 Tax=Allacma fusca TaxID=39272 RepID=A0A8J2L076_9HEXA|nr:unnamed protein product [Allacma fusca]
MNLSTKLSIVNIVAILPVLSIAMQGTNGAGSFNDPSEAVIWNYFLEKYSSSQSYLTPHEVRKFINSKCRKNGSPDEAGSESSFPDECAITMNKWNNVTDLRSVCSLILYQIDNPSCCSQITSSASHKPVETKSDTSGLDETTFRGEEESLEASKKKPSSGEVWGFGILFVTLISLSSLVGVSVLPLMGKDFYKHMLTSMVGLAVGSLTGSAVFHLIPQAFALNERDPNHGYLFLSLVICGGIWMFFMVERILKFIMDYKDRKEMKWKHEKMLGVLSSTPENSTLSMLVDSKMIAKDGDDSRSSTSTAMCAPQPSNGVIYECQEQAIKASFGHQEKPRPSNGHEHVVKFEQGKDSVIATVAWMIIFGDGLHNFIDGLSIGAAFNESILTGVSISVAVLCEELPHELGDFAVLLNAGMSMRQALLYNFLSACTCYFGLGFGILLGEIEATSYIFALAGGMFLYIALVDMVPEMNEIAEETSKLSVMKGLKVLVLQNLGLFTGITILFVLAKYQDNIQF